jgi:hypothetical protein
MGPTSRPETSVPNYQSKLHNIAEERRSDLQGDKSLKSYNRFSYPQQHSDQIWEPLSLLFPGYQVVNRLAKSGQRVKLTTSLHLAPRLRMSGATSPCPHMPSWHAEGQLYLHSSFSVNAANISGEKESRHLCPHIRPADIDRNLIYYREL